MRSSKAFALLWVVLLLGSLVVVPKEAKAKEMSWWIKESNSGRFNSIAVDPRGNIIAVGNLNDDILVVKLDPSGHVLWQKTYGGSDVENARDCAVMNNGNIVVVGDTVSFGAGGRDAWILYLDPRGNVIWQKTYGGPGYYDGAMSVSTTNGNILVAGYTTTFGETGEANGWILKLDTNGNVIWQKTYGQGSFDAITVAPNGDIIAGGIIGNSWIVKLDSSGAPIWQVEYNGGGSVNALTFAPSGDIIAGGGDDAWILKLTPAAQIVWQKIYTKEHGRLITTVDAIKTIGNNILIGSAEMPFFAMMDYDGNIKWAKNIPVADIETLPDGTVAFCERNIIGKIDPNKVSQYSGWNWDKEVYLVFQPNDGTIREIESTIEDSNAQIQNTNAKVYDTNVQFKTAWTYTPSINVLNHKVTIIKKVSSTTTPSSIATKGAVRVTYKATTTIYQVKANVNGAEKSGYLINHAITILSVQGSAYAFRTLYTVSKDVAYSVNDMILPQDAIIIQREPVIALDIKDPKAGEEANQTVIILTDVPESKFTQGVKITHEVITSSKEAKKEKENSKGICGPGLIIGLSMVALFLRKKR